MRRIVNGLSANEAASNVANIVCVFVGNVLTARSAPSHNFVFGASLTNRDRDTLRAIGSSLQEERELCGIRIEA